MAEPPTVSGRFGLANSIVVKSATGSDRFYSTLALAKAGAVSGETIVLGPGTYSANASLSKNGVNWHLYPGATISGTGNFDLFTDAGGATSYIISGAGRLLLTGHGSVFIVSNSSSVIRVTASEIIQTGPAAIIAAEGGMYQTDGELHVKADKISGYVSGVYWDKGVCFIEAGLITGTIGAIYSQSAAANSHLHITANEITCTATPGSAPISVDGSTSAAIWITAHRIVGYDYVIQRFAVKLYITTQKLEAATTIDAAGLINSEAGGFLYLSAQKIEALASTASTTALIRLKDATSYLEIGQLVSSGITDAVVVSAGTHFIEIEQVDTQGNGITCDTGTVTVVGAHITSGSAKKDLIQTNAGTLNIRSCFYTLGKTTGTITNDDTSFLNFQTHYIDVVSDSTALSLFDIALTTLTGSAGTVNYELFSSDGTNVQVRTGVARYSVVNKAGSYTSNITIISEGVSASSGTLTATLGFATGTNKVTFQITPATSLSALTYYVQFIVNNISQNVITVYT